MRLAKTKKDPIENLLWFLALKLSVYHKQEFVNEKDLINAL